MDGFDLFFISKDEEQLGFLVAGGTSVSVRLVLQVRV
jgi:hypothetical protein